MSASPLDDSDSGVLLKDDGVRDGPIWVRVTLRAAFGAAGAGLAAILLSTGERAAVLPELVELRLSDSGVSNRVTAVLLNFRAYDTLLEVAVLIVAMIGVWSLDRGSRTFGRDPAETSRPPVLDGVTRLVVPLVWLMAVYLTWVGSRAPGGAFQAAALLAGGGVLMTTTGLVRPLSAASSTVRAAAVLGLGSFALVGIATLLATGSFLRYPEGWAYPVILVIESLLTASIAVVLVELFADVPSVPDPDPALARVDPTGDPLGRALRAIEDVVGGSAAPGASGRSSPAPGMMDDG